MRNSNIELLRIVSMVLIAMLKDSIIYTAQQKSNFWQTADKDENSKCPRYLDGTAGMLCLPAMTPAFSA